MLWRPGWALPHCDVLHNPTHARFRTEKFCTAQTQVVDALKSIVLKIEGFYREIELRVIHGPPVLQD